MSKYNRLYYILTSWDATHKRGLYGTFTYCRCVCSKSNLLKFDMNRLNSRQYSSSPIDMFKCMDMKMVKLLSKKKLFVDSDAEKIGLLSSELINNWKSEWWRFIYPLYLKSDDSTLPLLITCDAFFNTHHLYNEKVFLSSIENLFQNCRSQEELKLNSIQSFIFKARSRNDFDSLCFAKLVEEDIASEEYEKLCLEYTKWLRKYFRKPAKTMVSSNECDVGIHDTCYYDEEMKGKFTLQESFCLDVSRIFQGITEQHRTNPTLLSGKLKLVVLVHPLQGLLAATFADAYHSIKVSEEYNPELLCLHRFLAPIKSAVAIEGSLTEEKCNFAQELCHKIQQMNISCWNCCDRDLQYNDLDEIGVPYCLTINDQTMENGLLGIRNRDTSLSTIVHISELFQKLHQYLSPK